MESSSFVVLDQFTREDVIDMGYNVYADGLRPSWLLQSPSPVSQDNPSLA